MEPIIKSTGKNVAGSKRKGGEPSDRIHSSSVPEAAPTPVQMMGEQSKSDMMGSAPLEPLPNHLPPTSRSQPSQQRPPPAACNAAEETVIRSPEGAYIPPLSAREIDYHRMTNSLKNASYTAAVDHHNIPPLEPQSVYLPQAAAYSGVDVLPRLGSTHRRNSRNRDNHPFISLLYSNLHSSYLCTVLLDILCIRLRRSPLTSQCSGQARFHHPPPQTSTTRHYRCQWILHGSDH
jgi:hypothetical protein